MKIKNSNHRGDPMSEFQIFSRVSNLNFSLYIKKTNIYGLPKSEVSNLLAYTGDEKSNDSGRI